MPGHIVPALNTCYMQISTTQLRTIIIKSLIILTCFFFWQFVLGNEFPRLALVISIFSVACALFTMGLSSDPIEETDKPFTGDISELDLSGPAESLVDAYYKQPIKKAIYANIISHKTGERFYLEFRKKRNMKNDSKLQPSDMPGDTLQAGETRQANEISEATGETEKIIYD